MVTSGFFGEGGDQVSHGLAIRSAEAAPKVDFNFARAQLLDLAFVLRRERQRADQKQNHENERHAPHNLRVHNELPLILTKIYNRDERRATASLAPICNILR